MLRPQTGQEKRNEHPNRIGKERIGTRGSAAEDEAHASQESQARMARKMDLLETAAGLLPWSLRLRIIN
jgi:hypothetical protein